MSSATNPSGDDPATPVRLVPGDRLQHADPTPGMARKVAFQTPTMWTGIVDTQPGAVSGWHHHGPHESTLYVVEGLMRMESGPGGEVVEVAGPGDFLHVPPWAVHREANPGEATSRAVIVRAGEGPPTVNVDGPAPAGG